jgi:ATP-dependent Clp protease adaptor protein ClpS
VTTAPQTERVIQVSRGIIHPYAVILHNDDVHSMEYVVDALVKSVPTLSEQEATEVMMKAHSEGRAVVVVCPLEQAELYRDRLQTFGLGASIEPA